MLTRKLELYDIADAERFCSRILDTHLARTRGYLNAADREDALSYLVATTWELSQRYDPTRNTSFSNHAHSILSRRVIDWYRSRFGRDQRPNITPVDSEQRRNVRHPDALDTPAAHQVAAPNLHERDSLAFAVRALNADRATDCDPHLFELLERGARSEARSLDLQDQRTPRRTTRRDRTENE